MKTAEALKANKNLSPNPVSSAFCQWRKRILLLLLVVSIVSVNKKGLF